MSDENDQENAHIRALLAELGSGPDGRSMPPDVAARLDDTLARLVAEREAGAPTSDEEDEGRRGTVVPLRRRWVQRTTAAAAAVIIVGAGGVAAANLGVFGNGASVSSDSSGGAHSEVAESAPEATASSPDPTSGTTGRTDEDSGRDTALGALALPQVSASSFRSDVTSLLRSRATTEKSGEAPTAGSDTGGDTGGDTADSSQGLTTPEEARQTPGNAFRSTSCPGPAITDGAVPNPIRYDEQLAVLVIHPEKDGQQLVEAWNCAGDRRLAETTITP
ncbi:MAG: hypothetical protein ABWX73_06530 [Marmoricola sp.]